MWTITNNTPFAAERGWVRDRDGAEIWLVAVKGTFAIDDHGNLHLANEQVPVCLVPEYRGDRAESSLLYDSDFHRTKLGTDVLLHGHAYAPRGIPTTQVDVSLKVGHISKTLRVFGDRLWEDSLLGPTLSNPQSFTKMPLVYERSFGGVVKDSRHPEGVTWDRRNPVGVGFSSRESAPAGRAAPNIEDPRSLILDANSRPHPVGFGPVASHWAPRVDYSGTYDRDWEETRMPLVPEDLDDRFYQAAPEDQQVRGFLQGGEFVELIHLTPDGHLGFALPEVSLGLMTVFSDRQRQSHRAEMHSVIIEPDESRVLVVWRSQLRCHNREEKILTTIVDMKRPSGWSESSRETDAE